jgi:hypothetical protein
MRLRTALLFLIMLLPSAFYAIKNPGAPEFGKLHDDGILFVSAKSIATGEGFRILSLPEQPAQTKYPVLYPLYLSLVWRINPNFPQNLVLAGWFSWALLVVCLALTWIYWRGERQINNRWSEPRTWVLLGLLSISPYMIRIGCNLFSEIFFLCWLLAALIAGRREGLAMALLAGVLAGLAYLSRTAGIALLISMPAWYLIGKGGRREPRRALVFAAGMMPFILGWTFWSSTHRFPATTQTLIYYTDYVKYQFLNVGLDNLPIVLWKNIDELLFGMGSLFVPEFINLLPVKILTEVVAIAMIAGIIRLVRRGIAVPYALFALVSAAMLVVWHFPPNQRFVLPLFPLLAAGLITELEHSFQMLRGALRHKDVGQRVVAGVFAAIVLAILCGGIGLQLFFTFKSMPEQARADRAALIETRATYAWIEQHLPTSAGILSNDDPTLYLYTGRHGNFAPLMPRWWYAADKEKITAFYKDVVPYCLDRGFQYILATPSDMSRWGDAPDQEAIQEALKNPQLEPLYKAPSGATVFRIKPDLRKHGD